MNDPQQPRHNKPIDHGAIRHARELSGGTHYAGRFPQGAPGSREAYDNGCTCPVMDNGRGLGHLGSGAQYGWWVTEGCPLHGGTP